MSRRKTLPRYLQTLHERRRGQRMDQTRAAEAMRERGFKWSRQTLGQVENGQRRLSVDEFLAYCEVLGVEPADVRSRLDQEEGHDGLGACRTRSSTGSVGAAEG